VRGGATDVVGPSSSLEAAEADGNGSAMAVAVAMAGVLCARAWRARSRAVTARQGGRRREEVRAGGLCVYGEKRTTLGLPGRVAMRRRRHAHDGGHGERGKVVRLTFGLEAERVAVQR